VIGVTFAMGVGLLFGMALACEAKANLHPLPFYTIEFTSPGCFPVEWSLLKCLSTFYSFVCDFDTHFTS
jgi:hypothetical protein